VRVTLASWDPESGSTVYFGLLWFGGNFVAKYLSPCFVDTVRQLGLFATLYPGKAGALPWSVKCPWPAEYLLLPWQLLSPPGL
jgi:hypothetical protein